MGCKFEPNDFLRQVRATANKDFAERLKEELGEWVGADNCISYPRVITVLYDILNELAGDNK